MLSITLAFTSEGRLAFLMVTFCTVEARLSFVPATPKADGDTWSSLLRKDRTDCSKEYFWITVQWDSFEVECIWSCKHHISSGCNLNKSFSFSGFSLNCSKSLQVRCTSWMGDFLVSAQIAEMWDSHWQEVHLSFQIVLVQYKLQILFLSSCPILW